MYGSPDSDTMCIFCVKVIPIIKKKQQWQFLQQMYNFSLNEVAALKKVEFFKNLL